MRQLLSPVVGYLAHALRSLSEGWTAFWYSPADPALLGLLRILTGLMLFYTHAVWGLALEDFFGSASWLNAGLVQTIQAEQFAYSFWWWVPPERIWHVHGISLVILAMFTIGLWTRWTSILALVVVISYAHRVPEALFGLDQINVMLTLYLTIGSSGRALSVDRWLARRRGSKAVAPSSQARLALRLIQLHMCVIYFFAGISKLQGPSWWSGEAMWRAFANAEYQSADMTWLAWHPWLLNLITHVTIVWECSFCVLIWNRLWRPLILVGAVALHVGIGACLGMWTFGLIMLVGCASFLSSEAVRRVLEAWSPGRIPSAITTQTPDRPMTTVTTSLAGPHKPREAARSSEPTRSATLTALPSDRPLSTITTHPTGPHPPRRTVLAVDYQLDRHYRWDRQH